MKPTTEPAPGVFSCSDLDEMLATLLGGSQAEPGEARRRTSMRFHIASCPRCYRVTQPLHTGSHAYCEELAYLPLGLLRCQRVALETVLCDPAARDEAREAVDEFELAEAEALVRHAEAGSCSMCASWLPRILAGWRPEPARAGSPAGPAPRRGRFRQSARLRLGTRYRVEGAVASGGMGSVYAGYDEELGRPCAIKVLHAAGSLRGDAVERFRREALLAETLGGHPGLAPIYDCGAWPETGELYCVMPWVEGEPLGAELERPRLERVRLLARAARVVAHAHARDVVHRDLKPDNILVDAEGGAWVIDFGIAKFLGHAGTLTPTGAVLGTPAYLAPEQLDDSKRVTPAADVYSLGAVLFELLTGRPPFLAGNLLELLQAVAAGACPAPRELDPGIPAELDALCRRALDPQPGARPSARELAEHLEAWADARPA